MKRFGRLSRTSRAVAALLSTAAAGSAQADDAIKIGVVTNSVYGPFFIAESRGYFKTEKLDATLER